MDKAFIAILAASLAAAICTPTLHAQTWYAQYNPAAETFPDDQGWLRQNTPDDTEPWLADSLLHMDTTILQYLNWQYHDAYICFHADQGFVLECRLKVNSSSYVDIPSSRWRIGYIFSATDTLGRIFRVGIADTGVIMSNDADWYYANSTSFVPYATAGDFHTYRLLVQDGLGQLSIDATPILSLPVGPINQMPANTILFGDATYHAESHTQTAYVRFGSTQTPGDLNDDTQVDLQDLALLSQNWLNDDCSCTNPCNNADLNHSTTVDLADFALFAQHWPN